MIRDLRLYQLISPNLPIGGFTYSQGLEWAVEAGWVTDLGSFQDWLSSLLEQSMTPFELPLLRESYAAVVDGDHDAFQALAERTLAGRETSELRAEEQQRGAALARLLSSLEIAPDNEWLATCKTNQISGFAWAGAQWGIDADSLCLGYLWAWLEGATVAGVKLIPLGQTQGQQLLLAMNEAMTRAVQRSTEWPTESIGATTFAQAIASAQHETQYTRLYRS